MRVVHLIAVAAWANAHPHAVRAIGVLLIVMVAALAVAGAAMIFQMI